MRLFAVAITALSAVRTLAVPVGGAANVIPYTGWQDRRFWKISVPVIEWFRKTYPDATRFRDSPNQLDPNIHYFVSDYEFDVLDGGYDPNLSRYTAWDIDWAGASGLAKHGDVTPTEAEILGKQLRKTWYCIQARVWHERIQKIRQTMKAGDAISEQDKKTLTAFITAGTQIIKRGGKHPGLVADIDFRAGRTGWYGAVKSIMYELNFGPNENIELVKDVEEDPWKLIPASPYLADSDAED